MQASDINDPEFFHQVIDCQYACPAHTPVPEYIRLISEKRYDEAYLLNWHSNVFPGILGRVCDRPCEPACRRGRVEKEAVAICRLKRVCADNREPGIETRFPAIPEEKNGKRIALIGAGPASLTVARDLAPLGYSLDLYDDQEEGGGFMRSQLPSFRLPDEVLKEEVDYILNMGIHTHFGHYVDSMAAMLTKGYDAIFVGSGAAQSICGFERLFAGGVEILQLVRIDIFKVVHCHGSSSNFGLVSPGKRGVCRQCSAKLRISAGKVRSALDPGAFCDYPNPRHRGLAQLVEHRSPKPRVVGSSPSAPATLSNISV